MRSTWLWIGMLACTHPPAPPPRATAPRSLPDARPRDAAADAPVDTPDAVVRAAPSIALPHARTILHVVSASAAPVIAFIEQDVNEDHVWVSHDDGAHFALALERTWEEQRRTMYAGGVGSLRVDSEGRVYATREQPLRLGVVEPDGTEQWSELPPDSWPTIFDARARHVAVGVSSDSGIEIGSLEDSTWIAAPRLRPATEGKLVPRFATLDPHGAVELAVGELVRGNVHSRLTALSPPHRVLWTLDAIFPECDALIGDTYYVMTRSTPARMRAIHADGRIENIRLPGLAAATAVPRCTIVGSEHAIYARIAAGYRDEIFRIVGGAGEVVAPSFGVEPVAVDSHGALLAAGGSGLVRWASPTDQTVLAVLETGGTGCFFERRDLGVPGHDIDGYLVDGKRLRAGSLCDTPDRVVLLDDGSVYSIARTPAARVIRKPITRVDSHDGCAANEKLSCSTGSWSKFHSATPGAPIVEQEHQSGPLELQLLDGDTSTVCEPLPHDAIASCSTPTRLAVVRAVGCGRSLSEPGYALALDVFDRRPGGQRTSADGQLDVASSSELRWVYRFGPDMALTVVGGAHPSVSLQLGDVREDCFAFIP
jgi:hypothetical protein